MRLVNFSNWSVRWRIFAAFVVLGLVVVSSALYTRGRLISANTNIDHAFHNELPSAIGVLKIASVTRAISMDVRGYLASGDTKLRDQAFKTWVQLEAMLAAEKARAAKSGDRALAGKLDELSGLLVRLKKTHTEIAAIAFTPDAFPATQKFEAEIAPRVEKLLKVMAMLVEVEIQQPASSERRHLLKAASDMQAHFATVASHLRSFLDSGSESEKSRFWTSWIEFGAARDMLEGSRSLLLPQQLQALDAALAAVAGFEEKATDIIAIRSGPGWNISQYRLLVECVPETEAVVALIDGKPGADGARDGGINDVQLGAMSKRETAIVSELHDLVHMQLIATLVALISSSVMTALLVPSIANPVTLLTGVMGRLKNGETAIEIPGTDRGDELGEMARAVAVFRDAAIEKLRVERQAEDDRAKAEAAQRRAAEEEAIAGHERERAIAIVSANLSKLAASDLTARIAEEMPAAYQTLKLDFNDALERLAQAFQEVHASTSSITSGSSEIANAADDLSRRTEQQAASLEETAAAMAEITRTVTISSQSAEQAGAIVSGARQDANTGGEVVQKTIAAMSRIEKSSNEINNIIGVIDEIAFQTNLLALNAGVEAARAGEAGRGFAVVATEVRALAQRSAEAARQIKGLIATSSGDVKDGVELVGEAGAALAKIIEKVVEIEKVVAAIASGAREQSMSLSQINTAVGQMDQSTQQNATMVEETTAAAKSLGSEAQKLEQLVGAFKVSGGRDPLRVELAGVAPHAFRKQAASPLRSVAASRPVMVASGRQAASADDCAEF